MLFRSNVQKFTHLRSCLSGRALKCIEGYSVTNDNYSKAFQDLQNRFGQKRLLANELVKSTSNLDIPEKADPTLSMVLLPVYGVTAYLRKVEK